MYCWLLLATKHCIQLTYLNNPFLRILCGDCFAGHADTTCLCVTQVKILSSIITAILPGIVLTIFLALLPTILSLLNKKVQKMVSQSDVEFGVVRKYFAFQVGIIEHPLCSLLVHILCCCDFLK